MTRLLCVLAFVFFCKQFEGFAQRPGSSYQEQTRSVFIYNVGSAALISGLGAIITEGGGEKWPKRFLKGFLYGGIGGYCMYQSKNMLNKVNTKQNISYYWPAKLMFCAGESIAENALANRKPWSRWHINFWLSRFDIDFNEEVKTRVQVDFIQAGFLTYELVKKNRLDIPLSLKSGIIVLDAYRANTRINGNQFSGYANASYIVINNKLIDNSFSNINERNKFRHEVFAHEMVHTFQFNNYPLMGLYGNDDMDGEYVFYLNPSRFLAKALYIIEGFHDEKRYYRNFFEFEAEYFATKSKVDIR